MTSLGHDERAHVQSAVGGTPIADPASLFRFANQSAWVRLARACPPRVACSEKRLGPPDGGQICAQRKVCSRRDPAGLARRTVVASCPTADSRKASQERPSRVDSG